MKFAKYVGIDYSGAKSPDSGLTGLRIHTATQEQDREERPSEDPRRHWTRLGAADFLFGLLSAGGEPILIGIDHGFSFPIQYFDTFHPGQSADWSAFLEDFCQHWPTDRRWVRDCMPEAGRQQARLGHPSCFRLTELRARSAKSVFRFNVNGSVGKSTHAGLPWLRYLRKELGNKVHFWPFDGWTIPDGVSAIVEVYPRLWNQTDRAGRTQDQHDAWSVAQKFRSSDRNGSLPRLFEPNLNSEERIRASYEGWIVGVD
jgi:hypothetical protein